MEINNNNKTVTIYENDTYSLIGTIKSIENPAITLLNIKFNNDLDNDIIHLGELVNSETIREWPEVNDSAVAILRNKNNAKDNEILFIYYVPNNTFIFGNKEQLKIMYQILFTGIDKAKTKFFNKENDKTKVKIYDFKKLISI